MKSIVCTFVLASLLFLPVVVLAQEKAEPTEFSTISPANNPALEPICLLKRSFDYLVFDYSELDLLNPAWIQGIEVLKHTEDAQEIFGDQAENGVIIFELKEEHLADFIALLPKERE